MTHSIQPIGDRAFHLMTDSSSVVLEVGDGGHLELLWFGDPLRLDCATQLDGIRRPRGPLPGCTVDAGTMTDPPTSLHRQPMAFATAGKGDYRRPGLVIDGQGVLDLTCRGHRIIGGGVPDEVLPSADPEPDSQTLEVILADDLVGVTVTVRWTTFPAAGVFTVRTTVSNTGPESWRLLDVASVLIDLPDRGFDVITLDGWWGSEAHITRTSLGHQRLVNSSATGSSSTEHNPGTLLMESGAGEDHGRGYACNLLYSGSHATSYEGGSAGLVRMVSGINPEGFGWCLDPGADFVTPEAVLSYTASGTNGIARAMHRFVNASVVPRHWRHRERPIVLNNWEGTYLDFDLESLTEIAQGAAWLGAETFVLDDGWFGHRRDDETSGIGDWWANTEKLPGGLEALIARVQDLGLEFGLWVEPESVSQDSDLYRAHPEWAIHQPGRAPSLGRHQLLLDLTRDEVRDHLVLTMGRLLDDHPISFIKWDMNRLISDAHEAGFHHRYVLGLYDVLARVFGPRPHVLLESCSSGGNRFDLGMLTFGPQIWASDCTDAFERIAIQRGVGMLYPASTISAHVSAAPNHLTGRAASLDFRFAVSAPYVLGIELDPRQLSQEDMEVLRDRVAWYKTQRAVTQFGEHRWPDGAGDQHEQVVAIAGDRALAWIYARFPRRGVTPRPLRVPGTTGPVVLQQRFGRSPSTVQLPDGALAQGLPMPLLADGQALIFEIELGMGRSAMAARDGAEECI